MNIVGYGGGTDSTAMLVETTIDTTDKTIILADTLEVDIQSNTFPLNITTKTVVNTWRSVFTQQVIGIISIDTAIRSFRISVTACIFIQDTAQIRITAILFETFRFQSVDFSLVCQQVIGNQTDQDTIGFPYR